MTLFYFLAREIRSYAVHLFDDVIVARHCKALRVETDGVCRDRRVDKDVEGVAGQG